MLEVCNSHTYKLDVPPGIHPVFHASLLKRDTNDPLPSQTTTHNEPGPTLVEGQAEYNVEEVLRHRRRGRGWQLLVKWEGWAKPTWEPLTALHDTIALAYYETTHDVQWAHVEDSYDPERR